MEFLVWEPLPLPLLRLFVLAGVWRLLKLLECRHLPIPLVTLLSSMVLQIITQSFLNCLVRMAYRNGLQQLFNGRTKTVKTLAPSREMSWAPHAAVREKNAMGNQQTKSVNTNRAIRLAILESLEFHAWEPRMAQYIF